MKRICLFLMVSFLSCISFAQNDDIYFKDENANTSIVVHDTIYIVPESEVESTYKIAETNCLVYYVMGMYCYRLFDKNFGWYFLPVEPNIYHRYLFIGHGMHRSTYNFYGIHTGFTPAQYRYEWHRYHKGGYAKPKYMKRGLTIREHHKRR